MTERRCWTDKKETRIIELVERLWTDLGVESFRVVDHWPADLCAIGLASIGNPRQLAYISTYHAPSGARFQGYFLELETPGDTDEISDYKVAATHEGLGYRQLRELLVGHLGI